MFALDFDRETTISVSGLEAKISVSMPVFGVEV